MKLQVSYKSQKGATLIVGLIMLALITLLVTSAFSLSGSNLKAVGNMQFRNEALAAANAAIETVIGTTFTTSPSTQTISVDINNDNIDDYNVNIEIPVCMRASISVNSTLSSLSLPITMSSSNYWNTLWDIKATVTDLVTGASVQVHSGTRVKLSDAQKNSVCS